MDIWTLPVILSKLVFYWTSLAAIGAFIFAHQFETPNAKRQFDSLKWARKLVFVAGISACLIVWFRAVKLTADWSGLFDRDILGLLWQTQSGVSLRWRIAGLILLFAGLYPKKWSAVLGLLGALITAYSFTVIGHSQDFPLGFFQLFLMIHVLIAGFWIGALVPLYKLSGASAIRSDAANISHKFGSYAIWLVPLLIVAGVLMAYRLLGSFGLLFTTNYGQTLLLKIALVAGLLALAALNKLRITPQMIKGEESAFLHFRRSVGFEILLVAFILLTTSILTSAMALPTE